MEPSSLSARPTEEQTVGQGLPTLYSEYIHQTRYARWSDENGRRETWSETVRRYIDFIVAQARRNGYEMKSEDIDFIESSILNTEAMCSMRALMTAGKAAERDNIAIYNCVTVAIDDPRAFDEVMYMLMCGCGCGFSVERQFIGKLPEVPDQIFCVDDVVVVDDSRKSWAGSLRRIIAMLYAGHEPKWDLSRLRPAGARLKTFGGRSSGPAPLNELFYHVISVFRGATGRRLTSLECHSIMCKIGDIVVSGGVRRSALISLSNPSDERMRDAKIGNWSKTDPHFALANNSAVWTDKPDAGRFMREWISLYDSKSGERGLINRKALQRQASRSGRRSPDIEYLVNPCCVSGDTLLMTTDGPRRIDSLEGQSFQAIVNGKVYEAPNGSWVSGEGQIFRLVTKAGYEIELTPEHRILTSNRGWVAASGLSNSDKIVINNHQGLTWDGGGNEEDGYLLGLFVGDGNFMKPEKGSQGEIKTWEADSGSQSIREAAMAYATTLSHRSDWNGWGSSGLYYRMNIGRLPQEFGIDWGNKHVTQEIEMTSSDFQIGFLRGIFDADGHVEGSAKNGWSVRLGQSDLNDLKAIQRMLLRLGMKSRIYHAKDAGESRLPDGKGGSRLFPTKASWRLVISSSDLKTYADRIGFVHEDKSRKINHIVSTTTFYSKKFVTGFDLFEFQRVGEVWDAEVLEARAFDANGIYAHNSEIILRSCQACNLTEIVARADDSLEDLKRKAAAATIMGTIQATCTDFDYVRPIWRENCEEERLLGVSITGEMDHPVLSRQDDESESWKVELRELCYEVNADWAGRLGIQKSAAITCQKPSGTVSQLVDSASGGHPRFASFYLTRTRDFKMDPVAEIVRMSGVPCEQDSWKQENWVFEWPVRAPEGSITTGDMSALAQLERWLHTKEHWCEHTASATIMVKESEWIAVGSWVYDHFDDISGLAFFPINDHIYTQAPFEEITEEEYERRLALMPTSIDWNLLAQIESEDNTTGSRELACSGGSCDLSERP